MDNQPWLDRVRERLARQALPPSYVQRFLEELTDHFNDLVEEKMESNPISRLGQPEQVAENAVAAYRRRRFLGRHPLAAFLVFGVSPMLLFIVLYSVSVILVVGGESGMGVRHDDHLGSVASEVVCFANSLLTVVIPSILATVLYCRLAKRAAVGKHWMLISCAILAVIASMPVIYRNWPGDPKPYYWFYTMNWTSLVGLWHEPNWSFRVQAIMQFFAPLGFGWWLMRRKHGQKPLQLAA